MITSQDFKHVMAHLAGAVTVITTCDEGGQPWGFTATAFCSLSLEPPLVLCCLSLDADCYEVFVDGHAFAVNILSTQQRHISQLFATKGSLKYQLTTFTQGPMCLPLLPGALATLECKLQQNYAGGDHSILIGLVEYGELSDKHTMLLPLLHYARTYGTFADSPVEREWSDLASKKEKKV
jgi:flavin reductase ActVB